MPDLYIIAGPNGAGKSTAAEQYLPAKIFEKYIPFDSDKLKRVKQREFYLQVKSYKEAGKMADEFVDNEFDKQYKAALESKDHFVYEGHFTEDASWELPKRFQAEGYKVRMIFMGLDSVEKSNTRVTSRAMQNGHNVHPADIERNYYGNLDKLNEHYAFLDELVIVEASTGDLKTIMKWDGKKVNVEIADSAIPEWVKKYLPDIYKKGLVKNKKQDLLPKQKTDHGLLSKNKIRRGKG